MALTEVDRRRLKKKNGYIKGYEFEIPSWGTFLGDFFFESIVTDISTAEHPKRGLVQRSVYCDVSLAKGVVIPPVGSTTSSSVGPLILYDYTQGRNGTIIGHFQLFGTPSDPDLRKHIKTLEKAKKKG